MATNQVTGSCEGSPAKVGADASMDGSQPSIKEAEDGKSSTTKTPANPAAAAEAGDIDAQIAILVTEAVKERSVEFEDKLKYWKGEVDQNMLDRFNALNASVLGQLTQIQNDIDT